MCGAAGLGRRPGARVLTGVLYRVGTAEYTYVGSGVKRVMAPA